MYKRPELLQDKRLRRTQKENPPQFISFNEANGGTKAMDVRSTKLFAEAGTSRKRSLPPAVITPNLRSPESGRMAEEEPMLDYEVFIPEHSTEQNEQNEYFDYFLDSSQFVKKRKFSQPSLRHTNRRHYKFKQPNTSPDDVSTDDEPSTSSTISAIPESWIKNGWLHWPTGPKTAVRKYIKAGKLPDDSWLKLPCNTKTEGIKSLKQANMIADTYDNSSDTESEEGFIIKNKTRLSKQKEEDIKKILSKILKSPQREDNDNNHIDTDEDSECVTTENERMAALEVRIYEMDEKITDGLANINAKLDKIIHEMKGNAPATSVGRDKIQNIVFPLTTPEQVRTLELLLSDEEIKEQLLDKLCEIGGKTGNQNGTKIAFKLAEFMFDVELLPQFSWTGTTRCKIAGEKYAFMKLENVLNLFYQVIQCADRTFTKLDNENFFKLKALKHSQLRLNRKCLKAERFV